ncbi:rhamnogalacturonan acetylesterase [Ruficoccus sp. ZRK36]|uniref:rhamnogalacturonan acetylesterase n=1 Tax=Ruficoccus sp. ZRK36 TaxID=2866311 RepID=UPI001C72F482|nr:rhamnogalacturonan acetylesterase [Ruficoccus sp. ZRK36]QYY35237.1 rhamnogalacturonan acetylesterase [Ruficoccus sp. ZRK36]
MKFCLITLAFAALGLMMPGLHAADETVIVLVGDSTVTGKSRDRDQAGWGWALQQWTRPGVKVVNTAVGGRSSRSFRTEGRWDKALKHKPDWILIQFGHNDQKGKGPERESAAETDYRDHLRRYIKEAREIGAEPVLISSVCRRNYRGDVLKDSLEPYAEAVRIVAEETGTPYLDLHAYSYEQLTKMGPQEAALLGPQDNLKDHTHFSTDGARVVADWVVTLMREKLPELAADFDVPADAGELPKPVEK